MSKLLVILGSTSTGKTDVALRLAKKFNGELVSCDSRQVYTGLDIGTGKMPSTSGRLKIEKGKWVFDDVPIYMYDVIGPNRQYTVYHYVKDANKAIDRIVKKGKLPIVVGGTGLYLKALIEGLPSLVIPIDQNLRKQLNNLTRQQLQQKLQKLDKKKWESFNNSDKQNPRRLIRAIESASLLLSGLKQSQSKPQEGLIVRNDILKIGLTAPRNILYKRIDERVIARINQGMINEAESLHKAGLSYKRMKQLGLEYGILADSLKEGIVSKDDLVKILQGKIHGYARRQITWFKKEKDVYWFDITCKDYLTRIENVVAKWYDNS